jgi:hypothetical protein
MTRGSYRATFGGREPIARFLYRQGEKEVVR